MKSEEDNSKPGTYPKLDRFRTAFRAGDMAAAEQLTNELLNESRDCVKIVRRLFSPWDRSKHRGRLLDILYANRRLVFGNLAIAAYSMQFCGTKIWQERFAPELKKQLEDDAFCVQFSEGDFLGPLSKVVPSDLMDDLTALKWHRWPTYSGDSIFVTADREVRRLHPQKAIVDLLWSKSRYQHVGREEWDRGVAAATVVEHFCGDVRYLQQRPGFEGYFPSVMAGMLSKDPSATKTFLQIAAAGPMMLATWHGSFFSAVLEGFKKRVKEGVRVVSLNDTPSSEFMITTGPDRPNAPFLMIKAVSKGRVVLIASDGGAFTNVRMQDVLGLPLEFARGTAFVTHEAGCAAGFYSVERAGDEVVPFLKLGPTKRHREKLASFEDRWFEFYIGEIEQQLTGDPRSLPLRGTVINNMIRYLFKDVS